MLSMRFGRVLSVVVVICCVAGPVSAQVDLSGTWASRMHEDWVDRWPGPEAVDYTGLPLNEDGRARALAYAASSLSQPERQCLFYQPTYTELGPFNLKIWSEVDPLSGQIASWNISGASDRAARAIWMDGRPHPSENAGHTFAGFSTREWQGNTLVVYTTHMTAGYLRRNGVPASDQTVMSEYITRHAETITIVAMIEDPAYLTEPTVVSRSWQLDPTIQQAPFGTPCIPIIESPGQKKGAVPHYLPGENPFVNELTKFYHVPVEATLGGAETLYPEYRKKLKAYVAPEKCSRYCCGWGGPGGNGPGFAPNLMCLTPPPP